MPVQAAAVAEDLTRLMAELQQAHACTQKHAVSQMIALKACAHMKSK